MYVDILILAQLTAGPRYGYEIKKSVEGILGSNYSINHNTLYPSLRRFAVMGAIQKEIKTQDGKPNRHVYRITNLGVQVLQSMLCDFTPELAMIAEEFQIRVAFFEMLDFPTRIRILQARKEVLEKGLAHMQQVGSHIRLDKQMEFARHVIELQESLVVQELNWISDMQNAGKGE